MVILSVAKDLVVAAVSLSVIPDLLLSSSTFLIEDPGSLFFVFGSCSRIITARRQDIPYGACRFCPFAKSASGGYSLFWQRMNGRLTCVKWELKGSLALDLDLNWEEVQRWRSICRQFANCSKQTSNFFFLPAVNFFAI